MMRPRWLGWLACGRCNWSYKTAPAGEGWPARVERRLELHDSADR